MNRLQFELRRLFAADAAGAQADPDADAAGVGTRPAADASFRPIDGMALIGPANDVRALVLEVVHPAGWSDLGRLWQGAQTDLELPAPAIAVSGVDGLQLWFSLLEPVAAPRGHDFLLALAARFLPAVARRQLRFWPAPEATASRRWLHAREVPAEQGDSGNWSAFVAPDLAPVFADTPWLDIPPGEEGQLSLLRGLRSILPGAFDAAWQRLEPAPPPAPGADNPSGSGALRSTPPPAFEPPAPGPGDPERFLQQVMNDASVPLALRIEAAKALLPR